MAEEFSTDGMLDMYLFENGQLLEQLQDMVLEQKDADCFDEDSINEIFRTMHTIKGSSGIMMFDEITAVAHKLEDVFYFLRESHPDNVPHLELVDHVLEVADFISNEMEKIRNGDPVDGQAGEIVETLDEFLNKIKAAETAEKAKRRKARRFRRTNTKSPNSSISRLWLPAPATFIRFTFPFSRRRKWRTCMLIKLFTL